MLNLHRSSNDHHLLALSHSSPSTQVYEKVISAAAAKLQMMLRCDQLPVGELMARRFPQEPIDDSCPQCGDMGESEWHTFCLCPNSWTLRDSVGSTFYCSTNMMLTKAEIPSQVIEKLANFVFNMVRHWEWWQGDALHAHTHPPPK